MKKITDYAELVKAKHALNKTIAPVEDGANMAGSYTTGKQFIRDGVLYTALTSIAASTAFSSLTLDTDYEVADDITSQLGSVNSALSNKYGTDDTAETDIDDADYFPFYDSSATAKRKSLWSNIKSVLKTYFDTLYATITTVNNKHKVSVFEVTTSSWTQDTTSQSGTTLQKKAITLSHCYVDSPSVDIGAASGSVLPTTAQQTAYDLLQYVTLDGTTLYLYASDVPTDAFYINVEGVD